MNDSNLSWVWDWEGHKAKSCDQLTYLFKDSGVSYEKNMEQKLRKQKRYRKPKFMENHVNNMESTFNIISDEFHLKWMKSE